MASEEICTRLTRDIAAIDDQDQRLAVVINALWIAARGNPVEVIRTMSAIMNSIAAVYNDPDTNAEVPRLLRQNADLFEKSRISQTSVHGGGLH